MASIEFIQKRIAGKENELNKLTKKLERIRKAESGNWETNNPYYYREDDLKYTIRDIESAQKALDNFRAKLNAEVEKSSSRNVKAILDFLEMWKEKVREYYGKGLQAYYAEYAEAKEASKVAQSFRWGTPEREESDQKSKAMWKAFKTKCVGVFEDRAEIDRYGKKIKVQVKVSDGEYEYLRQYTNESTLESATVKLNKELEQEATRKYDFIIERTNAIVGTITDASNLTIGEKDDLNGFIIGTNGVAKVQTIGAGGYNIQCFHFRTLINEMNAK